MTEPEANLTAGAAFWAARGVRIEPEPIDDESSEVTQDAEPINAADEAAETASEPTAAVPEQADGSDVEFDVAADAAESDDGESDDWVDAATDVDAEAWDTTESDATESDAVPFIPAQASLEEVEPQPGDPVDGLAMLGAAMAEARRARELDAEPAEPAWQLSAGELAAPLPPLKACVEAVLMVVDEPVSAVVLAQVVERPKSEVEEALRALAAEYADQGRGFELREVGTGDGDETGWRMYSRAECAPVVERFVRDGQQARLTQAALETLAVVAYRQPVSRSKVSAIRGVNCDGVMRTLLARGLLEECGTEHETGALLYRTTGYFLERMGLKSLDELPDLAPLLPSAADLEEEA
jgi:segregation and condensation protein B